MKVILLKINMKEMENLQMKMVNIIQENSYFVKGNVEGNGKYIYENGDYYIGEFVKGLKTW